MSQFAFPPIRTTTSDRPAIAAASVSLSPSLCATSDISRATNILGNWPWAMSGGKGRSGRCNSCTAHVSRAGHRRGRQGVADAILVNELLSADMSTGFCEKVQSLVKKMFFHEVDASQSLL